MDGDVDISAVARLIGDRTRASILEELSASGALPASELARRAGVAGATASAHLAKLVAGRLLVVEPRGRHRYHRLADGSVARALEALAVIAPPHEIRSLRHAEAAASIRAARTCYDHLAGTLGVQLTDALEHERLIRREAEDAFTLTERGATELRSLGLDLEEVGRGRRPFARACLDWSERRYHLAGALGAALTARLFELQWIERRRPNRSVTVTELGREGLAEHFGLELVDVSATRASAAARGSSGA
jgi:DNA-binding transcriptional ArsR family regulator